MNNPSVPTATSRLVDIRQTHARNLGFIGAHALMIVPFAALRSIALVLIGPCIGGISDSGRHESVEHTLCFDGRLMDCAKASTYLILGIHFGIRLSLILEDWVPSCGYSCWLLPNTERMGMGEEVELTKIGWASSWNDFALFKEC